jgi:hypothetical protein
MPFRGASTTQALLAAIGWLAGAVALARRHRWLATTPVGRPRLRPLHRRPDAPPVS